MNQLTRRLEELGDIDAKEQKTKELEEQVGVIEGERDHIKANYQSLKTALQQISDELY